MLSKNFKFSVLLLLVFLFTLSFLSAISTNIKIKTLPYHDVYVAVVAPTDASYTVLHRFNKTTSNYYGDVAFVYDGSSGSKFNLVVDVKLAGKDVVFKKFYNQYETGNEVYIEIAPDGKNLTATPALTKTPAVNTSNQTQTTSNNTQKNNASANPVIASNKTSQNFFTNFVVFGENGIISKTTAYIIIGVIVVLAVIIIAFKLGKRKKDYYEPTRKGDEVKVRKLSEYLSEQKSSHPESNKALLSAEKKLQEAEKEINKLKNKEKIDSLKREIQRLERGN